MSADVVDIRTKSRRAVLNGTCWFEAATINPALVATDDQALALLTSRLGEIADAYLHGHQALEHELVKLNAATLAWLDRLGQGTAA